MIFLGYNHCELRNIGLSQMLIGLHNVRESFQHQRHFFTKRSGVKTIIDFLKLDFVI